METRTLGVNGPLVSIIGLGCNNFGRPGSATIDAAGTDAVISAAIEAGITLLDTADIYNGGVSESLIGEVLGSRRDQVVLATKFGHSGASAPGAEAWGPKGSASYVARACEASLTRLRTDVIDVFQMHTPDAGTPVDETLGALQSLVDAGKIRWYGHSNFSAAQMREAAGVASEHGFDGFTSAQNHYSLLARGIEDAELGAMNELGLGLLPYFPLANGLLTGKYAPGVPAPEGSRLASHPERLEGVNWDALESFRAWCTESGLDMGQASIAWLLNQSPVTSVISGATTPAQVARNAAAAGVRLDATQVASIIGIFA